MCRYDTIEEPCPDCDGGTVTWTYNEIDYRDGSIIEYSADCEVCRGSGRITVEIHTRTLEDMDYEDEDMRQPLEVIEAALHYNGSCQPFYRFEGDKKQEPSQGTGDSKWQATLTLLRAGLITKNGEEGKFFAYRATDGLKSYIEGLQAVDLPKQVWVR
jgi:hypothetical protein